MCVLTRGCMSVLHDQGFYSRQLDSSKEPKYISTQYHLGTESIGYIQGKLIYKYIIYIYIHIYMLCMCYIHTMGRERLLKSKFYVCFTCMYVYVTHVSGAHGG